MKRRLSLLVGIAAFLFVLGGAVKVYASDGPYNTNPNFCRHADLTDAYELFLWWYHECWYPDPPSAPN